MVPEPVVPALIVVFGPPLSSPRFTVVPRFRMRRVALPCPRSKVALTLPKLGPAPELPPLLNRKVPVVGVTPSLLMLDIRIVPVKLFMVPPPFPCPPAVTVELVLIFVMITVPLPDQSPSRVKLTRAASMVLVPLNTRAFPTILPAERSVAPALLVIIPVPMALLAFAFAPPGTSTAPLFTVTLPV